MPKIYKYIRFSTTKQDAEQQDNTVSKWLESKGLAADETITDSAVHGYVSFRERNLNGIMEGLEKGDTLVVSELSRLTRGGISALYEMISGYFKPNGVRLVICNLNLDINCANIDPMEELKLSMMATFAKIEREYTSSRTKSALEVRKAKIAEQGGFTATKSKEWRTGLGRPKGSGNDTGIGGRASGASKVKKITADEDRRRIYKTVLSLKTKGCALEEIAESLNGLEYTTPKGKKFTRAAVSKVLSEWGRYFEMN